MSNLKLVAAHEYVLTPTSWCMGTMIKYARGRIIWGIAVWHWVKLPKGGFE